MKYGKTKVLLLSVLIFLFILSTFFVVFKIIERKTNENSTPEKDLLENIEIESETEDENIEVKKESERQIQLKEFMKENDEIIAWLEIDDTNISYPVLYTDNNDYYVTHNYKKEKSKDGAIFLDTDYDFRIPSTNLLIYGHNNENGKMFSTLLKYKNKKYYTEHPTIRYTTLEEDAEFEIIAAFYSKVYYQHDKNVFRYYFFLTAKDEQEFNEYVNNCKKASIYDTGITAEYGDQLLTLSTCAYHTEDGRFVVVARKKQV